mmetsp:Transcript_9569/g.39168  ORF Transcript_9569/g.39168 Transcript_9569/m.39168 type:complete len:229 (-) Transcript_9569:983-1669(-)
MRRRDRPVPALVPRRERVQARETVGRAADAPDLGAVAGVLPRALDSHHAAVRPREEVRVRLAPARHTHPEPHTRLRRRVGSALPGRRRSSARSVANVQGAGVPRDLPLDGGGRRGAENGGARAARGKVDGGVPGRKRGDLRHRSELAGDSVPPHSAQRVCEARHRARRVARPGVRLWREAVLSQAERPVEDKALAAEDAEDPADRVLGTVVHLVSHRVAADGGVRSAN